MDVQLGMKLICKAADAAVTLAFRKPGARQLQHAMYGLPCDSEKHIFRQAMKSSRTRVILYRAVLYRAGGAISVEQHGHASRDAMMHKVACVQAVSLTLAVLGRVCCLSR